MAILGRERAANVGYRTCVRALVVQNQAGSRQWVDDPVRLSQPLLWECGIGATLDCRRRRSCGRGSGQGPCSGQASL